MDKRRENRHCRQIKVTFGEKRPEHIGLTADVSASGTLIRANRIYPPQTAIVIVFSLPDQQNVYCRGVVQWAKRVPPTMVRLVKNGMGIALKDIHASYQKYVDQLNHPEGYPYPTPHQVPLKALRQA